MIPQPGETPASSSKKKISFWVAGLFLALSGFSAGFFFDRFFPTAALAAGAAPATRRTAWVEVYFGSCERAPWLETVLDGNCQWWTDGLSARLGGSPEGLEVLVFPDDECNNTPVAIQVQPVPVCYYVPLEIFSRRALALTVSAAEF